MCVLTTEKKKSLHSEVSDYNNKYSEYYRRKIVLAKLKLYSENRDVICIVREFITKDTNVELKKEP